MPKFPSQEWLKEFQAKFNACPDNSDADKAWKGSIGVAVTSDQPDGKATYMFMYMQGGQCTEVCMIDDPKSKPADITMSAPLSTWRAVFEQKTAFITALARRKIKVEGNSVALMRYVLKGSPKKWRVALLGFPAEF